MKKLALLAAVAASCGPKQPAMITPTLPGEGTDHTAKPAEPPPAATDPWTGRTDLISAPAPKSPQKMDLPPVERFTLPNGLQVLVVQDKRLPVVSMQLAIKAGRSDEPRAHIGIAEFAADMLVKGTKKRTALDIAKAVDFVGGGITVDASYEATVASCKVMSKSTAMCLDLLPDIVQNATFPADEMPKVRDQIIAQIHNRLDDAATLASLHAQNLLWGDDHVRGWTMDDASIKALTSGDLAKWRDIWFSPSNAILAVAGDVDPKKIKADITKAFGGWKKTTTPPHPKYAEPKLSGVRIRLVDKPHQTQTHIRVAQMGIRHDDPRFFDALVWNYALGGGEFSSRLTKAVRVKGGKSYGASSTFDRNLERGSFVASTFTRNSEAVATTKLILDEIKKMAGDGPSKDEVSDAIANIAGSYQVHFESAEDVTGALLGAELHGFGDEYIENYALAVGKVTPDSAKQAAHEILDPTNFVIVMVGDASEVEPQLKAEGWKYEKFAYTDPIGHPPPADATPPPVDPKAEAAGRALLDQALAAKGGEAKLRSIKSIDMLAKGGSKIQGQDGTPQDLDIQVERRWAGPGKTRMDVTLSLQGHTIPIAYAVSGGAGWQQAPDPQTGALQIGDIPGDQMQLLAQQEWTDPELVLLRYKEKGAKVRALPDQAVDGTTYALVNITSADDKQTVTLFIDKKTHLVRQIAYPEAGTVVFDSLDDYKAVEGIQVAHHRVNKSDQQMIDLTIQSIKLNPKLGDDVFARPAGAKAP